MRVLSKLKEEDGSIIVIALVVLALVTVIGISSTNTTSVELQIAANEKFQKIAFYSAESGWQSTVAYLDQQFPLITDDVGWDASGTYTTAKFNNPDSRSLSTDSGFAASADFTGTAVAPGYGTDFKRFLYTVTSSGSGPNNAQSQIIITCGKIDYVGGY